MKLLIAISSRYLRTPDGKIWTKTAYDRDMWREVQAAFEKVDILARVLPVGVAPDGGKPAGGPGITYIALPEWNSWKAPLLLKRIYKMAASAVSGSQAVLIHSPSPEAELAFHFARKCRKPMSVECRGEQSMSAEYWKSRGLILASLLSRYHTQQFRRHLSAAWGCVFVSGQLQSKYGRFLENGSRSEVISDIRIPGPYFSPSRVGKVSSGQRVKVINVGRLEAQKDQATLIQACARLDTLWNRGWELHLVGEGPMRESLEDLVRSLQVKEKVIFHGFVPWGDQLFSLLDRMDLFVLSSISEGLPRVLVEAMARGLPCISTDVSGADELLGRENLIPCRRPDLLATRLAETVASHQTMNRLGRECQIRAQDFRLERLKERKIQFLRAFAEYVKEATSQV